MNFLGRFPQVQEKEVNETVEVLKQQLAYTQQQNQYLLNKLLEKPNELNSTEESEPEPLVPKFIPWTVKRQLLEEEDRAKAKVIREAKAKIDKDIKDLETELNVLPVEPLILNNGPIEKVSMGENDASKISETV